MRASDTGPGGWEHTEASVGPADVKDPRALWGVGASARPQDRKGKLRLWRYVRQTWDRGRGWGKATCHPVDSGEREEGQGMGPTGEMEGKPGVCGVPEAQGEPSTQLVGAGDSEGWAASLTFRAREPRRVLQPKGGGEGLGCRQPRCP